MGDGTWLLVGAILLVWQLTAMLVPVHRFPGLIELAEAVGVVVTSSGRFSFGEHVPLTLVRIALSVVFAMIIGVPLGVMMGSNEIVSEFISPYVLFTLAIPALMWSFLAVIWFGLTTYLVPVFVGVLILMPYVVINTWEGTKDIDRNLIEMTQVFEVSSFAVWRHVYLPHLMPYLFATIRMTLSVAWKIMLIAELFGTQSGLGYIINSFFINQRNDMIIAWAIPVMAIIFVAERLIKRVEKRAFEWRTEPDTGGHLTG